jgi:hypothetical protein
MGSPRGTMSPVLRLLAAVLACALLSTSGAVAAAVPSETLRSTPLPSEREGRTLPSARADALTRALEGGGISPATYALERARSLFELGSVRDRYGDVAALPSGSATAVLRDLVLRIDELSPSEQALARRILARPDDSTGEPYGSPYSGDSAIACSEISDPGFCIHWATSLADGNRPPLDDTDTDGTPDWVETTVETFETVWAQQVGSFGFRPPKDDLTSSNPGPDGRIDIYLANTGEDRVYGYCTTDDPRALKGKLGTNQYPYYDVSAYCVIDNDFSAAEFGEGTPLSNLQVTAAHEFFHAIQFGYDYYEDFWMLEGTATAMEDLIYDDIDDNYQYLAASQFVQPHVPVDYSANDFSDGSFLNRYGSWVFWRFLMEHLAVGTLGVDPAVLLEIWERADSSPARRYGDATSIQAVTRTARGRGADFKAAFGFFGASLYAPEMSFDEAPGYLRYLRLHNYGRAPFISSKNISRSQRSARIETKIDHLSHKLVSIAHNSGRVPSGGKLRLRLEGPRAKKGTVLTTLVVRSDDTLHVRQMKLNTAGDGRIYVPFGPAVVRVVVVLTNASSRFSRCSKHVLYPTSCGLPRDDRERFILKAKLA